MNKIKSLFETPKKAVIMIVGIIVAAGIVGVGTSYAARTAAKSSSIGAESAKNFAFADAGIDPVTAQAVRVEFDFEHGQFVYEVEFTADGTEYDYWIKASDGTVVKKELELIDSAAAGGIASAEITVDQAKETALADAGLDAADVTFVKEKLDMDNGTPVYELEFYAENTKYEYEINASTGAVYSKSKETNLPAQIPASDESAPQTILQAGADSQTNSAAQQSAADIGLDAAKNAALADAGVSASEATFTKQKQDYDDGALVYDIEFYTASSEYDYEIDAASGSVRSRDIEALRGQSGNSVSGGASAGSGSYIGVDQAKSTAAGHAGFAVSDVNFSKAKLDSDDGYTVYEVEFYKDGIEYEYKINAQTGDILEYDSEHDSDHNSGHHN